jgi:DNA-binding IclR family transcriptional regulator
MAREIQSLARGLDILGILADAGRPLGVTEVASIVGVDKSSAYRLLSTLAGRGFVEQNDENRRYSLGLRIVELSRGSLDRLELRTVARPYLKQLRDRVGESAHLAMMAEGHVVYIDTEASGASLNVHTEIGRIAPAHCTAIGKVMMAFASPDELERIANQNGLTRYTQRTITTLQELKPHLEIVRGRGYAVDDEEFEYGVRCVAAPVRDHRDKVIASVGISGPSIRVPLERIAAIGQIVSETGNEISHSLGQKRS